MKKKIMCLISVLFIFSATGLFAFGVGLQFNGNAGKVFNPGVALTAKFDGIPLVFAGNWYAGDNTSIGITGDYWVVNNSLGNLGKVSIMGFFGVGFYTNMFFGDEFQITGGFRIPFGLNTFLANGFFEPFLMIAPSFGLRFIPSFGTSNIFFPVSAGFRMWFK
ncbi:MAG TPA: hypothetical protein VJ861_05065 [Treponemataceae bacterium]|nr:hypothetical protein [Treponemataceae bacterium]